MGLPWCFNCCLVVDRPLWKILVKWEYYSHTYIWKNKIHVPNHKPDWDVLHIFQTLWLRRVCVFRRNDIAANGVTQDQAASDRAPTPTCRLCRVPRADPERWLMIFARGVVSNLKNVKNLTSKYTHTKKKTNMHRYFLNIMINGHHWYALIHTYIHTCIYIYICINNE